MIMHRNEGSMRERLDNEEQNYMVSLKAEKSEFGK